jgi:hypothetical protein
MELIVPLPMPKEEYEKDFIDEESRQEFNDLLNRTSQPIVIPWVGKNSAENIILSENRAMQYAAAGAFIVSHCQIMIALWNGEYTGETGGTSHVIEFMKKGIPYPYAHGIDVALNAPETGEIYHFWTPRKRKPHLKKTTVTHDLIFPRNVDPKKGKKYYGNILSQMDTFNKSVRKIAQRCPMELKAIRNDLIPPQSLPDSNTSEIAEQLQTYACADILSQRLQKRYYWAIRLLLGSTVFSIAISNIFDSPEWKSKTAYLLILLIAWILFLVVKNWLRWEDKYLDYRAMAEALRVQIFWQLAGIRKNILPYYLPQHRSELDWIRNALRFYALRKTQTESSRTIFQHNSSHAAIPFICKGWIKHQAQYFLRTSYRKQRLLTWLKRTAACFFILSSIVTAIIGFYTPDSKEPQKIKSVQQYHKNGLFISSLALTLAAALGGYHRTLAMQEEIRRYKIMQDLFRRGKVLMQNPMNHQAVGKAQGIFFTLGKNALQENGDWVFIHRGRMNFPG